MSTTTLGTGQIALLGAPDSDMDPKDSSMAYTAMQLEMTHDVVQQLLDSMRNGKAPTILFGRNPQLKYGDKTQILQTSPESHRYELYENDGPDSESSLQFAGLIQHKLTVETIERAEDTSKGVDNALERLKHSMAAIEAGREASKTIVGDDATPNRTPAHGHRRFPSKSFKPLAPSSLGSPLLSPMRKATAPTSQPADSRHAVLAALRVPLIHLLAIKPAHETALAKTCRASAANVLELLPKIAKRSETDQDQWTLTNKCFTELNPYKFAYRSDDREQAINNAIKAFDRLRLAKDDKHWQTLLPVAERGQGRCLSRLNVKAPEQKPSTPLHKMPKLTDKKAAATKKGEERGMEKDKEKDKDRDREVKKEKAREARADKEGARPKAAIRQVKVKSAVKQGVKEGARSASTPASATSATAKAAAAASKPTSSRNTPAMPAAKVKTKKVAPPDANSPAPRAKPRVPSRDMPQKERSGRPVRPTMPLNTKPKNPSPLSASPPVNASDFEDNHPVHKALSSTASPAKNGNSDRTLKRKANDTDSDLHNHNKQARTARPASLHTPASTNGRTSGSTPASASSLKRRSDDSSTSDTPTTKVRKVSNIDTGLASRYPHHAAQASPGDSSSSATSPSMPSLSFRQTVELSQKFKKYYAKYEELYWQLTESTTAPTEGQRNDLLKMHKKLEEMKREIKAGAGRLGGA